MYNMKKYFEICKRLHTKLSVWNYLFLKIIFICKMANVIKNVKKGKQKNALSYADNIYATTEFGKINK